MMNIITDLPSKIDNNSSALFNNIEIRQNYGQFQEDETITLKKTENVISWNRDVDPSFEPLSSNLQKELIQNMPLDISCFLFSDTVPVIITKQLTMDKIGKYYRIPDWDLQFYTSLLPKVRQEMWRHFSLLYRKAQNDALTDKEKVTWMKIIETIDYVSFQEHLNVPMFEEGTVKQITCKEIVVKWRVNNKTDHIPVMLSSILMNLKRGDCFSAMIKRFHNEIIYISDINLLGKSFADDSNYQMDILHS